MITPNGGVFGRNPKFNNLTVSDTIASVTDATNFVLTTGIPAGDGTYVAGTAGVYVARFKAAAVIAS